MGDVEEAKAHNVEHAADAPAKGTFMDRFRAHCKKFWWIYLIAFIIVVLVVVLPVIYVGYPNIAQKDVHASSLTITEMVITDPRPNVLHLRVKQVVGTDSAFTPVLDAFEADLTLEGAEESFGVLEVPSIKATDGVIAEIDQELDLENLDAFTEYTTAVMLQEYVEFNVYGETGLRQGSLPKITVNYDQQVTMKGLNALKGFDVTSFYITKEDSDVNMRGTILIPNPSVLTLTLGNLTFDLAIDGEPVGTSRVNDVVLRPGDNEYDMASVVELGTIAKSVITKYQDLSVPIDITGKSSVYHGEELTYFSAALAANTLTVKMNLMDGLGDTISEFF